MVANGQVQSLIDRRISSFKALFSALGVPDPTALAGVHWAEFVGPAIEGSMSRKAGDLRIAANPLHCRVTFLLLPQTTQINSLRIEVSIDQGISPGAGFPGTGGHR
jgi:hypothetical protein